jgi:SpoVK/Ycf46/Vps4 family AAA+-type ATPase
MEEMFQNVNPGLSRRFPLSSAFVFEDFTDDELQYILSLKLKQQGFEATGQAKTVVKEMLSRARNRPNYGNAGEIDILLGQATARHQSRLSKGETKSRKTLEALDFDENFDRAERTETNIRKLFDGTVGCNDIVDILEGYQETVRTMKRLEMDPKESIPFNFLFRGPPGTGKTTTAKKIGKVFYDMGFLATTEVIECSASDIIGQYVGQTGPKVRQILDKALGRVLFLDEAYRLCDGAFAKEAVDELVDAVTKDAYFKKIIVILAGYEQDINRLMSINSGLTSRFPEVINFRALSPTECVDLLCKELQRQQNRLAAKGHSLDLSSLEHPTDGFRKETTGWFAKLTQQDNWASARDVKTVTQGIFTKTIKGTRTGTSFVVREDVISAELKAMFDERESRSNNREPDLSTPHDKANMLDFLRSQVKSAPSLPQVSTATATTFDSQTAPEDTQASAPADPAALEPEKPRLQTRSRQDAQRDAGVSDEVWEQLQKDRAAEEAREAEYQTMLKARDTAGEEAREKIVKRLLEEEERRRQEAEMRRKLAAAGVCPAGFEWIKQEGAGYRCAGGSHFISEGQLAGI